MARQNLLKRYKRALTIAADNDSTAQRAAARLYERMSPEVRRRSAWFAGSEREALAPLGEKP